ncbi:MAG: PilZ domain-containing protein, partial [Pseudomonadota bacterium]
GSVWKQRLIDLSVAGVATDQPEVWDAQYNEPFTLVISAGDFGVLGLHAYLQHVEAGRLGFAVQHIDDANVERLRGLLSAHVDDPLAVDADIARLEEAAERGAG